MDNKKMSIPEVKKTLKELFAEMIEETLEDYEYTEKFSLFSPNEHRILTIKTQERVKSKIN